jgi:hypothetical protein
MPKLPNKGMGEENLMKFAIYSHNKVSGSLEFSTDNGLVVLKIIRGNNYVYRKKNKIIFDAIKGYLSETGFSFKDVTQSAGKHKNGVRSLSTTTRISRHYSKKMKVSPLRKQAGVGK